MGRAGRVGVLVAAAALLVAGCLVGAVLLRDGSDNGRSDGETALGGITLPGGWREDPE